MTRVSLGAIAVAACSAAAQAQTIRVGDIVTVARETDPRRISEPHLAIDPGNPAHLLAAAFIASTSGTPQEMNASQRCATFVSMNGGSTWTRHDFPLVDCGDPQVAILPDGQAVFVALARQPGVRPERGDWLLVFHSSDGGRTWDEAPTSLGWRHDHPAIAVDLASPAHKGLLYITSHYESRDAGGQLKSSVFVARSRDGGKTFDEPATPSPNNLHNFAEMPAVLSDGTVIVSFVDDTWTRPALERRRAWVMRSNDGGSTFSVPLFVNDACGPPPTFQLSALVVDASDGPFRDRLYFACRQNAGGSIVVSASADRGGTWARPAVVVGSGPADVSARRVPAIAVNSKGALGVMWVERRQSGADCHEVFFSASFDGGKTFVPPARVSTSSCSESTADDIAWRRFPTYGDYFGLVATPDGGFRLMWPEMRDGSSQLLTATVGVDGTVNAPKE